MRRTDERSWTLIAVAVASAVIISPQTTAKSTGAPPQAKPVLRPKSNWPEMVLQLGHRDEVIAVAFSPDSRILASAAKYFMDHSGEVKLWDVPSGALIRTLRGPLEHVSALAFAPDGSTLAIGSTDRTIRLWDVRTGKLQRTLPPQRGAVLAVAFSEDGSALASVSVLKKDQDLSSEINLWSFPSLRAGRSWQSEGLIDRVFFMRDGKHMLTKSLEQVAVRNTSAGNIEQSFLVRDKAIGGVGHQSYLIPAKIASHQGCRAIAMARDNKTIATGVDDAIILWNMPTGKERRLEFSEREIKCIAFAPDGKTVVAGFDDQNGGNVLRWWDVATGRLLRVRKGPGEWINDIAWAPDGLTLACGEARHVVSLWDARSGQLKRPPLGHVDAVGPMAFSPGGSLITGNEDGTLRWWNLTGGTLLRTINEHVGTINGLAFSHDGSWLASAGEDGLLQMWSAGGRRLHKWKIPTPEVIAASPDNRLIATVNGTSAGERTVRIPDNRLIATVNGTSAGERTVRIWDAQTGKLRQLIKEHNQPVLSATFSPDNKTLATASYDAIVKLWDVGAGVCRATLRHSRPVSVVAYSRDGRLLASGAQDGIIRLWDGKNSTLRRTLNGHPGGVLALCFAPDGMLLSAGRDQTVRRWNPHTGAVLHMQRMARLSHVGAFSRDGKRLAAVDADGATTVWDCANGKLLVSLLVLPPPTDQDVSAQWIAYTPEGYYTGSPRAAYFVRWRIGNQLFPAATYAKRFYRPDLLQKALHGGS